METRQILRRLLNYALRDQRTVLLTLLLLVIATGASVAGPYLIKVFIDDYLLKNNWAPLAISGLAFLYIFSNIIAAWLGYQEALRLNCIAQSVVLQLRENVFSHLLKMPLKRFDHVPVGSLISRVTNDTEAVKDLFVGVLGVYLKNSIRIIGIFIMMAILDWRLMMICLLFLPLVITVMVLYRRLSTPVFHRARELLAKINASLNESIQGVSVVQLFNQEKQFASRFHSLTNNHFQARMRTMQMDALLLRPMVDFLHLITLAGLLYYFGLKHQSLGIEIGVLYAFLNYLGQFTEPLIEMTQRLNLFQQSTVSAKRVFDWLDEDTEKFSSLQSHQPLQQGDIEFKSVHFSYEPLKPVLKQIHLTIPVGSFIGIVGHSGSGKSTVANLLMRFYLPESGSITLDGKDIQSYTKQELRHHFAIVQQESFLFRGTIAENINMDRGLDHANIRKTARLAGIDKMIEAMPDQYETQLAERGSNLSAGQRQLISLARALAGKPSYLILDEATSNVDSESEKNIQQALLKMKGKLTVIAIAHRLSTITEADQILVMHQGEIVQQGKHQQLLGEEGLYQHLYQLQFQKPDFFRDIAN